jgi:hypothetical protein
MINKTSTRFKVYEGVRLGEIQAATDGNMSCWARISGKNNTADWLTRGRFPQELNEESQDSLLTHRRMGSEVWFSEGRVSPWREKYS